MTIEEKLKDLILMRYYSIRDFTNSIDLPYTTLDSMFRRGIENSSVTNVLKVCKALGISMDALADGEIVPVRKRVFDEAFSYIDVEDLVDDVKEILTTKGGITLNGIGMNVNSIDSLIDALDVGVEIAKKKNTPVNPRQKP
jgi:hypothetical protein